MKRLILVACLVLASVVSIAVLAKRGSAPVRLPPVQDASLLLLRPPKPPTSRLAMFCLTNGTGTQIACVPEAFEQVSAGAWVRTPLTGVAKRAVRDWSGVPELLGPGEAFTFLVPPPTTSRVWRLVFMCQEQALVVDRVTDGVKRITDANARQTDLRQFSGRRYYATSPEVAP